MIAARCWWRVRRGRREKIARELRAACSHLGGLSGITEQDFLRVGAKLEEISAQARSEAETLTKVMESFRDDSTRSLTQLLGDVAQWAGSGTHQTDYAGMFGGLIPVVKAVGGPVRSLKNALRKLRVVGIMTRIESARLDTLTGEFEGLAEEVVQLIGNVDEKSDTILAAVDQLCLSLRETREAVAAPERRQREDLVLLVAACETGIGDLQAAGNQVNEVSEKAHQAYAQVSERIAEMVMSLQLHDATRQRLEHVSTALQALATDLTSTSPQALPADAAATVAIQRAQLSDTRDSFRQAVHQIRLELDCLHYAVAALGQAARLLGGGKTSGAGENSRVGDDLENVARVLDEWIGSRRALTQAAGDADQACARMSGFVQEIEAVGFQMLRLALNAQIHAVRLDQSGSMMEAVAAGIGSVSQEASAGAAAAALALREVRTSAAGLASTLADRTQLDAASDAVALSGRISSAVRQLHHSRSETRRVLDTLLQGADALGSEIMSLRQSLRADDLMENSATASLARLSQVLSEIGASAGSGAYAHQLTENLYTMEAERKVQQSWLASPAKQEAEPPVAAPSSEFGDKH